MSGMRKVLGALFAVVWLMGSASVAFAEHGNPGGNHGGQCHAEIVHAGHAHDDQGNGDDCARTVVTPGPTATPTPAATTLPTHTPRPTATPEPTAPPRGTPRPTAAPTSAPAVPSATAAPRTTPLRLTPGVTVPDFAPVPTPDTGAEGDVPSPWLLPSVLLFAAGLGIAVGAALRRR